MDSNMLIETWKQEEKHLFTGWDFSHLDGRMLEDQAPWSYSARAAELMHRSSSVVDLGTGGGERLLKLQKDWPKKVVATEITRLISNWLPNVCHPLVFKLWTFRKIWKLRCLLPMESLTSF